MIFFKLNHTLKDTRVYILLSLLITFSNFRQGRVFLASLHRIMDGALIRSMSITM